MHSENLSQWKHSHRFETGQEAGNERRTRWVVLLTGAMMIVEIAGGSIFQSMALFADGWHMATHVFALGIATLGYYFARKLASDARFVFGTAKIGALAAFTSAIILGIVALFMMWESGIRLLQPQAISFNEAIPIACVGLAVNILSAFLLGGDHAGHDHGHGHHDDHHHEHEHHGHEHAQDVNMRAAYIHVIADAFTSVLAITALLLGKYFGLTWMDPAMGIVGGLVISNWSYGLLKQSGRTLLDWNNDKELIEEIRTAIEGDADNKIVDLHVWKVGPEHHAAVISLVTHDVRPADHYRHLLDAVHELGHITVEVNQCSDLAQGHA
jgi:cation diffusion facilitator family transporter